MLFAIFSSCFFYPLLIYTIFLSFSLRNFLLFILYLSCHAPSSPSSRVIFISPFFPYACFVFFLPSVCTSFLRFVPTLLFLYITTHASFSFPITFLLLLFFHSRISRRNNFQLSTLPLLFLIHLCFPLTLMFSPHFVLVLNSFLVHISFPDKLLLLFSSRLPHFSNNYLMLHFIQLFLPHYTLFFLIFVFRHPVTIFYFFNCSSFSSFIF